MHEAIKSALARASAPACPTAILPLQQSSAGGSGAFLVRGDDGRRYWCKCLQSPQGTRVAVNEQVVGRLAQAIGAAACEVSLVKIPNDLEGWEFRPGHRLAPGYAHGSLAVESVIETRAVQHPADDDNPRRLTSLRVLADWCWAGDSQWLYLPTEDNRYFSHDHGHYFPAGPNWTVASLQAILPTEPGPGEQVFGSPEPEALKEMRARLANLDALKLAVCLSGLPVAWPVSDDELVEMVLFLDRRRNGVITRLNQMLSAQGGPP